jgi:hypothetical protein
MQPTSLAYGTAQSPSEPHPHTAARHLPVAFTIGLLAFAAHADGLLFDFGAAETQTLPSGSTSTIYWNNVSASIAANPEGLVPDLILTDGTPTPIAFQRVSRFNGANENGTTSSTVYPASATRDSLYGNTESFNGLENIAPVFKLTGLTASLTPGANNNNANHFVYLGVLRLTWIASAPGAPATLSQPAYSNSTFSLAIAGTQGKSYTIQRSLDCKQWTTALTVVLAQPSQRVEIPQANSACFYRAIAPCPTPRSPIRSRVDGSKADGAAAIEPVHGRCAVPPRTDTSPSTDPGSCSGSCSWSWRSEQEQEQDPAVQEHDAVQ